MLIFQSIISVATVFLRNAYTNSYSINQQQQQKMCSAHRLMHRNYVQLSHYVLLLTYLHLPIYRTILAIFLHHHLATTFGLQRSVKIMFIFWVLLLLRLRNHHLYSHLPATVLSISTLRRVFLEASKRRLCQTNRETMYKMLQKRLHWHWRGQGHLSRQWVLPVEINDFRLYKYNYHS